MWNQGDLQGFVDAGYSQSGELTFFSESKITSGKQNLVERYRWKYQTTHRELGLAYWLAVSLSAHQSAASGVPLGVLPQELAAARLMESVTFVPEMGQLQFDEVQVTLIDSKNAIVRGRWRLTFAKKPPSDGLFTLLFRYQDGQWWIMHDHSSGS